MRKIVFDLDDTLYKNENLRKKREKAIMDFLCDKKEEFYELKKTNSTINSLKKLGIGKEQFFNLMNLVPISLKKDSKLIKILERLRKEYRIILLSNNSGFCVNETLKKLGILHLFDEVFNGEDFKSQKPSKECFFMAEKNDVFVGNNFKKDLEVAKRMGAITIFVGEGEHDADFKINSIHELEKVLEQEGLLNLQ